MLYVTMLCYGTSYIMVRFMLQYDIRMFGFCVMLCCYVTVRYGLCYITVCLTLRYYTIRYFVCFGMS